ncbi:MAG: hypothetical protein P1U74_05735 [Legionellaceae bacterium]|nr:hypothetical protein [Legionellaceae bacterium]
MNLITKQQYLMLSLMFFIQCNIYAIGAGNPIDNRFLQSELSPIRTSISSLTSATTTLTSPSGGNVGTEYTSNCTTTGGSCLIFTTGTQVDGAMNIAANSNMFGITAPTTTGVDAGDSICQQEGNARFGSGKTWKSWLSTATENAGTRAYKADKIYFNVSRSTIALAATLLNGYLINPIIGFDGEGFTGTQKDGTASATNCSNWTSNASSDTGQTGEFNGSSEGEWTEDSDKNCDEVTKIYCFEQG